MDAENQLPLTRTQSMTRKHNYIIMESKLCYDPTELSHANSSHSYRKDHFQCYTNVPHTARVYMYMLTEGFQTVSLIN
jgi:hypothetical protein